MIPLRPVVHRERDEFRAMVRWNDDRLVPLCAHRTEPGCDLLASQPELGHQGHALARIHVDHAEDANGRPIRKRIVDEIHRPAFIRGTRQRAQAPAGGASSPRRTRPLLRYPFFAIEAPYALVIDRPAFALQQYVQASVAITPTRMGKLP